MTNRNYLPKDKRLLPTEGEERSFADAQDEKTAGTWAGTSAMHRNDLEGEA